ncbi:hypothetical protein VF21_05731 [Pseudogymnoascus sp. 05NY08]|nr:hypothetical protein VF21_05731 [Pseudogymnoascus sp. 05NY08]
MPSQKQNNGKSGSNVPYNPGPSTSFSLATIGTASVGPNYDPLAQWAASTFTRDNPVTDFLFEIGPVENPTEKGTSRKKSTQKKTEKQHAAHNKSTEKKPAHKKLKTK